MLALYDEHLHSPHAGGLAIQRAKMRGALAHPLGAWKSPPPNAPLPAALDGTAVPPIDAFTDAPSL